MLTIRLNQNGSLRAFQTNKEITLLRRADKAYAEIMHLITETERPGDTLLESGETTVLTERAGMPPPLAALRLSSPVDKGLTSPLMMLVLSVFTKETQQRSLTAGRSSSSGLKNQKVLPAGWLNHGGD